MKHRYNLKKAAAAFLLGLGMNATAQITTVLDFETFTLTAGASYSPGTSTPFQAGDASFQHKYNGYWSGGFAYTAVNDSINGTYTNLYGVRAYKGYTNSAIYVVGQDKGKVTLTAPQSTVNGFYVTNTTYAYKVILQGNQFSRKFGDTTGTGSGTTIAQGSYPDYFKLIVRGYRNGVVKNDSATFMLADFTFTNNAQDYVVNTWQYVNTSNLGEVDSLKFFLRSTDVGDFGMNTPAYFAIDNLSLSKPGVATGIAQSSLLKDLNIYPNPFRNQLNIDLPLASGAVANATIRDINGKVLFVQELNAGRSTLNFEELQAGVYFLELTAGDERAIAKIIRE